MRKTEKAAYQPPAGMREASGFKKTNRAKSTKPATAFCRRQGDSGMADGSRKGERLASNRAYPRDAWSA